MKKDFDGAQYALIIESSSLYQELNYGCSDGVIDLFESMGTPINMWQVHSDFFDAFSKTGFCAEMMNSCVVGFYKN